METNRMVYVTVCKIVKIPYLQSLYSEDYKVLKENSDKQIIKR